MVSRQSSSIDSNSGGLTADPVTPRPRAETATSHPAQEPVSEPTPAPAPSPTAVPRPLKGSGDVNSLLAELRKDGENGKTPVQAQPEGSQEVVPVQLTNAQIQSVFRKLQGTVEQCVRNAGVDDGIKVKVTARVGITGSAVSPPLFESMELLGRDKTLARLRAARENYAK